MCNPDKLNTSYNKVSSNIINDADITIIPRTSPQSDTSEAYMHPGISLKDLKAKNVDKVLIGHININFLKK